MHFSGLSGFGALLVPNINAILGASAPGLCPHLGHLHGGRRLGREVQGCLQPLGPQVRAELFPKKPKVFNQEPASSMKL